jgi:hypothetical protein
MKPWLIFRDQSSTLKLSFSKQKIKFNLKHELNITAHVTRSPYGHPEIEFFFPPFKELWYNKDLLQSPRLRFIGVPALYNIEELMHLPVKDYQL